MFKKTIHFLFKVALCFFCVSIVSVIFFRFLPVPFTPLMIIRVVERATEGKEVTFRHHWKPLNKISKNLQIAVIASEDQNFLNHNGFDFKAIEKAIESNKKGKRIKGGSTISQQTAKNIFLWPGRSYIRKGFEAYFTFLIEIFWSKARIMEVYLNSIEMGDGIYGAEASAAHWYGKTAANLTRMEAAGIAAILPNPRKFKARNSSAYINTRKIKIIRQMNNIGKLDY